MADHGHDRPIDPGAAIDLDDAALEALAESLASSPPPELRQAVLAAVSRAPQLGEGEISLRRSLRRWRAFGAVGLAAAVLLAVLYASELGELRVSRSEIDSLVTAQSELERSRDGMLASLDAQQREYEVLEEALSAQQEVVRILASPRLMTASLARKRGSTGMARVLFDPITGSVAVVGSGLEPPQAGRVYAIWAIHGDGTPQPAGVLAPSGGRSFAARVREVSEPRDIAEFAISIEVEGETARPTGPIILAGSVDRPRRPRGPR
jgi:anti-sigma-K factor RskA